MTVTELAQSRTLPHNEDAERALLGAVLTDGRVMDTLADTLPTDAFFRAAHQRIYAALTALYRRGDGIDPVTVKDELGRAGTLLEAGGPAYVAGLSDGIGQGVNVEYYTRIVKRTAAKRAVIYATVRLLDAAYDDEVDAADLIDRAERSLLQVSEQSVPGDLKSSEQMAREIYPVLEALIETHRPVTGAPTGLLALDGYTRGLQPGNLILLGGRPSMGKSTLGLQVALEIARSTPVAFFSVEMSQQEQVFRVLAALARVDGHHLQCGRLSDFDQQQVGDALTTFGQRKFWLDDSGSISALQIRSRARRLKARHGLGLIVVDYLQLLTHPKADSREERVAATGRLLKQIARELGVPLVALSQLARKAQDRGGDQRPQLSDLRESGALEQDADVVLLIHRPPEKSNGVVTEVPPVELIIAKQRTGPTAIIDMKWVSEQYRFAEIGPQ